jgi:hypothetical protein
MIGCYLLSFRASVTAAARPIAACLLLDFIPSVDVYTLLSLADKLRAMQVLVTELAIEEDTLSCPARHMNCSHPTTMKQPSKFSQNFSKPQQQRINSGAFSLCCNR